MSIIIILILPSYEKKFISEHQYKNLLEIIKKFSSPGLHLSYLPYARFYHILEKFVSKFRPFSYLGFADADRSIGNILDR